jgi:hypothetical protein
MFVENLSQFFDLKDFAVEALITDGASFNHTINVTFSNETKEVAIYDANVTTPEFNFLAQETDLAGVRKGFTATVESVSYKVARIERDGDGLATCYLSK